MGKRRMKLSVEERVAVVEKVLNREVGLRQAAKEAGVEQMLFWAGAPFMKMKDLLDYSLQKGTSAIPKN